MEKNETKSFKINKWLLRLWESATGRPESPFARKHNKNMKINTKQTQCGERTNGDGEWREQKPQKRTNEE